MSDEQMAQALRSAGWTVLEPVGEPYSAGNNAIHNWFNLTYASYLTLPRSVLQSMPGAWQERFVGLLEEYAAACSMHNIETAEPTEVRIRGPRGRYLTDPYADYERGRRDVFSEQTRTLTRGAP